MHSFEEWSEFAEEQQQGKLLEIRTRPRAFADISELETRMLEYVHYSNLCGWAVKLVSLNRLFGANAKRFDTTCHAIVQRLVKAGALRCTLRKNAVLTWTMQFAAERDAFMGPLSASALETFYSSAQ